MNMMKQELTVQKVLNLRNAASSIFFCFAVSGICMLAVTVLPVLGIPCCTEAAIAGCTFTLGMIPTDAALLATAATCPGMEAEGNSVGLDLTYLCCSSRACAAGDIPSKASEVGKACASETGAIWLVAVVCCVMDTEVLDWLKGESTDCGGFAGFTVPEGCAKLD